MGWSWVSGKWGKVRCVGWCVIDRAHKRDETGMGWEPIGLDGENIVR